MSPNLQVKINRVLQEHQFERIGGLKPIKVNIRVIAATNQDLEKLVQQGRFREDLYYRLNVIPIKIPPLRERTSDIPLLVKHFLNEFSAKKAKKVKGFTPEAMNLLVQYSWPGNVRELENLMERLVILADREILEVSDLPERFLTPAKENHVLPLDIPEEGIQLNEAVSEFERQLIIRALDKTGWVKNQAAQLLHLNRTTLIEKIKKQKISNPGEVPSDLTVKLI